MQFEHYQFPCFQFQISFIALIESEALHQPAIHRIINIENFSLAFIHD